MSIDAVLNRLQECISEIRLMNRVHRLAPAMPPDDTDLPLAYVQVGGTSAPAPRDAAGSTVLDRRYRIVILVATLQNSEDAADLGSQAIAAVIPVIDAFEDYFLAHPRLHTAKLPELSLAADVTFTDDGPVPIGYGGITFAGFEYAMNIALRKRTGRSS